MLSRYCLANIDSTPSLSAHIHYMAANVEVFVTCGGSHQMQQPKLFITLRACPTVK